MDEVKKKEKFEKSLMKAMETPEEKRARRLSKKMEKDRRRKLKMGWNQEDLDEGTNCNRFGDHNILGTFTWQKKLEKEGFAGTSSEYQKVMLQQKQEEARRELEKVKRRKVEREHEKMLREAEFAKMQREKEADQFKTWASQEDEFHLSQARKRSKLRIENGRAKPIDLLAAYVDPDEEDTDLKLHEPYAVLVGLSISDLEDLLEDISVFKKLEQGLHNEFWDDISLIAEDERRNLIKISESEMNGAQREIINSSVKKDVLAIFEGKTHSQLLALKTQISNKIKTGGSIDIGYWETLLNQLDAFMARARLKERHQKVMNSKILYLKRDAEKPSCSTKAITVGMDQVDSTRLPAASRKENPDQQASSSHDEDMLEEYIVECYSPKLISFADIDKAKWLDLDEDRSKLMASRRKILMGGQPLEDQSSDKLYQAEADRGMDEDEEAFNTIVQLAPKTYQWSDKFLPRKPKFFNRVHTGYEWNKYNQTHYDADNPPPKVVQGYKFSIFYPDLIDKTKTPQYYVTPCKDNMEFAVLKFSSGPPYEDIAFKIVNREWEYGNKNGFRCQFQNNIFQLWFHFKRYRYRR